MQIRYSLALILILATVSITLAVQDKSPQAPQMTQDKLFAQLGQAHAQINLQAEYIQTLMDEIKRLSDENKKLKDELGKTKDTKKSGD